jgi:PST family polysaccharide transporter
VFFGPVAVGLYRLADRLVILCLDITTRSVGVVALSQYSAVQDDLPAFVQA